MVSLRGSTCAFGFDAICLGSVTACGAGRVWAETASVTTVLIQMTIAKSARKRMGGNLESLVKKKTSRGDTLSRSCASPPCSRFYRRHDRCFTERNTRFWVFGRYKVYAHAI